MLARVEQIPAPIRSVDWTGERLLDLWLSGKSATTRKGYTEDLRGLAGHDGQQGEELADCVEAWLAGGRASLFALLIDWKNAMIREGRAPNSINRRLATMRSLIAFAGEVGMIDWQLTVRGVPAMLRRDCRGPGTVALAALVRDLESRSDPPSRRALAVVRLMFDHGLRRVEVARLLRSDVVIESGRVVAVLVLPKGRLERDRLTVTATTGNALAAWLIESQGRAGPYLFGTWEGGEIAPNALNDWIAKACRRAGIERIRLHGIRHTSITALAGRQGVSAMEVAEHGRHRDLKVTQHYLDQNTDRRATNAAWVAEQLNESKE